MSRTLNKSERNYSQLDKEALAIKWGVEKFFHYLYGRKFTLKTDHRPLIHILGNNSKLPVLSATRLLRYALYLQNFQFDIQYLKSELNGNADALSRLPSSSEELFRNQPDETTLFQLEQINTLPITLRDLKKATLEDQESLVLREKIRQGVSVGPNNYDYSLHDGIIFKGIRVYIPKKFRKKILEELHLGHPGIQKMKSLARSYVYWNNIDKDLEVFANNCSDCIRNQKNPEKMKTHYWEYPSHPWERLHVDFAGPFLNSTFFIVVDAHSKWMEAEIVPNTSSQAAMKVLEKLFARYGFPRTLVSDNGTAFTSAEFQNFIKLYGIKHLTSPPFHPASNGQAERYVFTLKQGLRCLQDYPGSLQTRLNIFLFAYRRAPNITTSESPAKLFLGREIRSRLDIFRPDIVKDVQDRLRKASVLFNDRSFVEGQKVAVRNYSAPNKKWKVGRIISKDGDLTYTVSIDGSLWRRHANQIRPVGENAQEDYPAISTYLKFSPSIQHSSGENPVTDTIPTTSAMTHNQEIQDPSTPETDTPTVNGDPPLGSAPPTKDRKPSQLGLRRSSRVRKEPRRLNL